MQYIAHDQAGEERLLTLPNPEVEIMPGVPWGSAGEFFTPAFWKVFAWKQEAAYRPQPFGNSLREELAACMLCGYGIPSELGVAAFRRLKSEHLLTGDASADVIEQSLSRPLMVRGKHVRYRFYRSKARVLAAAMRDFDEVPIGADDTPAAVRNRLMTLAGVGPKTASYVVRNYFGSDEVAVLDVHITRASRMLRIFPDDADPQRHYFELEQKFLDFARAIEVRASVLDNLMWDGMRTLEPLTRRP